MTAPTSHRPPPSAALLHDASTTLRRAAEDVAAGDVDRALERIDAAVATANCARAQLHQRRRRHTVAGVLAEVVRDHLQEDRR